MISGRPVAAASQKARLCTPGNPNVVRTPAVASVWRIASATVVSLMRVDVTGRSAAAPLGCRGSWTVSADADQLLVDELIGPVAAELAPEARRLDAAERELRTIGPDDVHVDHAGLDLVGDALGLRGVGREQVGAEPEASVVGDPDGLILRAHLVDLRNRAEQLVLVGLVVRSDVGEHRRRVEVAVALSGAGRDLGALADRRLDLLIEAVGGRARGERADRAVG